MAVSTDSTTRLGCGRDIDEVWASIDRPASAHEQQCVFCQEARASLARLAQVTAAQRRADADDPDLLPGPQVLTRVMEIARAEIRRGRRLPLDEQLDDGTVSDLTVSEQTVAAVVRRAGDTVDGVQIRRCRVELDRPHRADPVPADQVDPHRLDPEGSDPGGPDPERPDSGPATEEADVPDSYRRSRPARIAVFLQISVSAAVAIPAVGQQVRQAVRRAVAEEVGMHVATIDIDVRDIHDA